MKLRFSIRDLLWLTLVIGMALGWWLQYRKYAPLAETEAKFLLWQQRQVGVAEGPMAAEEWDEFFFMLKERLRAAEKKVKDLQEAGR